MFLPIACGTLKPPRLEKIENFSNQIEQRVIARVYALPASNSAGYNETTLSMERKSLMFATLAVHALVRRAQEGDSDAFASLVELYECDIRRYFIAHVSNVEDARDLTQQVFLLAWLHFSTLRDPICFESWLFRIARHQACDFWRRRKLSCESWDDLALDSRVAGLICPEQNTEQSELIHLTFGRMSRQQRRCLILHLEGFSTEEIAQRVGICDASVYTYICSARREFRTLYQQLADDSSIDSRKSIAYAE